MKKSTLVPVSIVAIVALGTWPDAGAGTTTAQIVADTVAAAPRCLSYRVTGVCFWLRCTPYPPSCTVITNMRVSHFSPEVVVSTWHEGAMHPWTDFGKPLAVSLTGAASGMAGGAIDSAGTNFSADRTNKNELYRDADAIGNPTNVVNSGTSSASASAAMPSAQQLDAFTNRAGSDPSLGDRLPASQRQQLLAGLRQGSLAHMASSGALQLAQRNGDTAVRAATWVSQSPGIRALSFSAPAASGNSLMCPATSTPFTPHFHSYLDAYVWRSFVPAELLYPQSWIPGMQEIGNFPLNTWGSVYPRHGGVTQQNPVKASAVLAQRVASIISQTGQPHIYLPLQNKSGYRYFHPMTVNPNDGGNSKWQRLYPNAERSCSVFGRNDSLTPVSWGDGNTTAEEAYSWNLWRRLECCKVEGIFIGSVTY